MSLFLIIKRLEEKNFWVVKEVSIIIQVFYTQSPKQQSIKV